MHRRRRLTRITTFGRRGLRCVLAGKAGATILGVASMTTLLNAAQAEAVRPTMARDLAERATAIHWPAGFEPQRAQLFAHNSLLIDAGCATVWRHVVDAARWPDWYPNAHDVTLLDGADTLRDGTRWRWTTFGLSIESRVHEYVPNSRLGWYGYVPGQAPTFYHSWLLTPRGDGCLVEMDEAGIGEDAAALRRRDEGLMHRGHDLWLATLRWVSEAR